MTDSIPCPDCGQPNPATNDFCARCNHPLHDRPAASPRTVSPAPAGADPPVEPVAGPGAEPPLVIRRPRTIRPRRPRAESQLVLQLWLIFGTICVGVVLWVAIQSNVQRAATPVEGSNESQQQRANDLFQALARDSTDVNTQRQLGDLLYDTANWSEAIVHYRAAVRRDSSLVTAIVDLGVCYFNLGHPQEAERHFLLALNRDPHQAVALFNLGIVAEGRSDDEAALRYYHRAMETDPPEAMKKPLQQRMSDLMKKMGRSAPPLPDPR